MLDGNTKYEYLSLFGSRRSLACAGATTLENQSWRVGETRRNAATTFIPGARNVVFRGLTTTLSRCRWKYAG